MRSLIALFVITQLTLFTGIALTQEKQPEKKSEAGVQADPRENLDTAIPDGIRLLEAKEYVKFLKAYAPPDGLAKFAEAGGLEKFAAEFGQSKGPRLLAVLKKIKGTKPELDETGQIATYRFEEAVGGKNNIVFMKRDKYWHIKN